MTDERLDSAKDKVTGSAKELEGKVTGDKTREAQGKGEKLMGKAKEKLADAKDTLEEGIEKVKEKVQK